MKIPKNHYRSGSQHLFGQVNRLGAAVAQVGHAGAKVLGGETGRVGHVAEMMAGSVAARD